MNSTSSLAKIDPQARQPYQVLSLRQIKQRSWQRYRCLPLFGSIVDDYARWCLDRGFSVRTVGMHLDAFRRLVPWFRRRGKRSIADLSLTDFREARRFYRVRKPWLCAGIRRLGDLLQERGRLKRECPVLVMQSEVELSRFAAHLREDCDLAKGTIYLHCHYVRKFLEFLGFDHGKVTLRDLKLSKIEAFICRMSRHHCRRGMPRVISTIRSFLRFQFLKGGLREPLHLCLESVRVYRDERLPHPLPWAELQKLLRLMDRSTPQGRRDFAILMLAASYGLRRSEVAALTLESIDWRSRILRLTQPKTGQKLLLPLTDEVAKALVDYLRRGRPATTCRHLFVRVRPPSDFLGVYGVAHVLERAVRATGVNIQTTSFHALRHAFALRLLLEGMPLKHISEVLGHRSFNTTSVYLRLDVENLRQVALPVPKSPGIAYHSQSSRCSPPRVAVSSDRKQRMSGTVTAPAAVGYRSFLAKPMRDFLRLRRALGRGSSAEEWLLRNLDFFLARHHANGCVFTAAMFEQWAAQQLGVSSATRSRWMKFICKFCLHLARAAPRTFVPDPRTFPKQRSQHAPCLLSQKDVVQLLAATHRPKPVRTREHPLRPKTMHLAVLLLYCCGLRRAEVLKLRLADIDTERQVLRIEQTKFHKSRLVPVSASVSEELRKYLQLRRHYQTPVDPSAPLLWSGRPNRSNGALSPNGLRFNWQLICRYAGVFNQRGVPPRLHDLRHSFAVAVLQRAYDAGQDPQTTLPRLARYMGHVDFSFTHHYLKFTEPLRLAADERFHRLLAHIFVSLPTVHH